MDRLHIDLATQNKYLIGGSKIKIRLHPNDIKFYLMWKGGLVPEVELLETCLYVHRAKIYDNIVSAHEAALQIAPAKYVMSSSKVKPIVVPRGSLDCLVENAIHGTIPSRLFLMCVSNDAYCGSPTKNPYNFQDFGINHLSVTLDGEMYP